VLAGRAGGGLGPTALSFAVERMPAALAAGDFDRDGRPDLAVACPASASISVLMGR
jgi:hypothetical protein